MKRLKNKVFLVIIVILTIFLLSILFIFNFQYYKQEESNIRNNLNRIGNNSERMEDRKIVIPLETNESRNNIVSPNIFMDNVVYVVKLNENNEVDEVTNHSKDRDITKEKIKGIAQNIINNNKVQREYIGNLYFNQYSYSFKTDKIIVIIDNTQIKDRLETTLENSLLIFVMLEIIIVYVAYKLTHWIIKPVRDSFDKQKQFIADASHELKTPLAVIIANSEALEKEPNEKKWLNNIKEESERMNNLITDLLDMAKLENEEKQQYQNENISKLVEKSILAFESLIYENNFKLEYKIEEKIYLFCNCNQIKQLVGILVDNAIKYSFKDGKIEIYLKKDKNCVILNVKNKGKEILKEEQEKIFERFYRIDEARSREENRYGLGLAIAKNIVEKHNGKISVNSFNGYNSFIITFKQV